MAQDIDTITRLDWRYSIAFAIQMAEAASGSGAYRHRAPDLLPLNVVSSLLPHLLYPVANAPEMLMWCNYDMHPISLLEIYGDGSEGPYDIPYNLADGDGGSEADRYVRRDEPSIAAFLKQCKPFNNSEGSGYVLTPHCAAPWRSIGNVLKYLKLLRLIEHGVEIDAAWVFKFFPQFLLPVRERDIEHYLSRAIKERGGQTRKVQWPGRKGAPDRLVLLLDRKPTLIELKAPGEKPKPHQLREHEKLRKYGFPVVVLDSMEAVDAWLQ